MPWSALESIPGLIATQIEWQRGIRDSFSAFSELCLEPSAYQLQTVRCPRGCGCDHVVIHRHDGLGAVAVCRCPYRGCPDLQLGPADVVVLQVSQLRLGRALCDAFGMERRQASLPSPNTFQFGAWSTQAVPAILTIQVQHAVFRRVVAELAAVLRQPFILLAPTSDFLDAPAKSILANHGAEFFALNNTVLLTERGTLQPTRPPGELFARFTPQPKEIDMNVMARAYALIDKLDTETPLPAPSLLTVFRLYCREELSMSEVAHRCKCDRTTIGRRLKLIRQRTGMDPQELRRLSPHIAKIEKSLRDDRARRIRPASLLDEEEGS